MGPLTPDSCHRGLSQLRFSILFFYWVVGKARISDNGIGMCEKVLTSAFSVDKSKRQLGTDGEKGTGLGLVLCKEFVEKHGGRIWLESTPGNGTKVFFTLPAES